VIILHKWECDKCEWEGNDPIRVHSEYEDGGWESCPNGCLHYDEPNPVILNFNYPENMNKYAKALKAVWG
jgi:hypothetical protein